MMKNVLRLGVKVIVHWYTRYCVASTIFDLLKCHRQRTKKSITITPANSAVDVVRCYHQNCQAAQAGRRD
jgi:hypothetical protein